MMLPKMLKEQKNQEYQSLKRISKRNVYLSAMESGWCVQSKSCSKTELIYIALLQPYVSSLKKEDRSELMYKTFINPATAKYAWTGLDECEVAYLNDFRWSPELIDWSLLVQYQFIFQGQRMRSPLICVFQEKTLSQYSLPVKGRLSFMENIIVVTSARMT